MLSPVKYLEKRVEDYFNKKEDLLFLKEDWDGEGAKEVRLQAWLAARELVIELAQDIFESELLEITLPVIGALPDGSIDLWWRFNWGQLLIHVVDLNKGDFFSISEKGETSGGTILQLEDLKNALVKTHRGKYEAQGVVDFE